MPRFRLRKLPVQPRKQQVPPPPEFHTQSTSQSQQQQSSQTQKPNDEKKLDEIITNDKLENKHPAEPPVPPEALAQDRELMRIKAIFPFDLFPDELIIQEKSVSVKKNYLIYSNTETMLIKDIGLVTINDGLFFASLTISYKAPMDDVHITKLWPSEAYKAKSFLEKMVIKHNMDTMSTSKKSEPDEVALFAGA